MSMAREDENIGRSRMLPPLPERMRPHDLEGYVGQKHLIGEGCILRNMIENFINKILLLIILVIMILQEFMSTNII